MHALIAAALDRSRTTILILLFLLCGGLVAYIAMPKESNPDVTIPMIYVSVTLEGISPEDGERFLHADKDIRLSLYRSIDLYGPGPDGKRQPNPGRACYTRSNIKGIDADARTPLPAGAGPPRRLRHHRTQDPR